MRIIYIITQEKAEKISEVRKTIKDKSTDKRLYAVELRGRGKNILSMKSFVALDLTIYRCPKPHQRTASREPRLHRRWQNAFGNRKPCP